MQFWWVNHKQTAHVEINEGYIWSPQKNSDNSKNETYLNLTKAKPGETIFSYANGKIAAVGKILSPAEEGRKPPNFGSAGDHWNKEGWRVDVEWVRVENPIKPKDYLPEIVPLLPTKNSPLQTNGNGNQRCYLAEIDAKLGRVLLNLLNTPSHDITERLEEIEKKLEEEREVEDLKDSHLAKTDRDQLIKARLGQGVFRSNVEEIETACRVTGLTDKRLLIASHIKPWRDSNNSERLDGDNGFLLSPHVDKLFDKGWVSFSDQGQLLVSSEHIGVILAIWSIDPQKHVGSFSKKQKRYLEYHRDKVLKRG